MGLGRQFVLGVLGFIVTVITMGYLPLLATNLVAYAKPGVTVEVPNLNAAVLLGLAILAGALVFLRVLIEKNNLRAGGLVGILRALVQLAYALVLLQMFGVIAIPTYNVTILITYVFVSTLIILGVVLNILASLMKIAAPQEFEKKKTS